MRVNYAMVFVSDMQRAVAFYRDVIGLPLKFQSPGWTEFATSGATLALHGTDSTDAATSHDAASADGRPGQCRPGFSTPDLEKFHRRMVAHGVPCIQEPKAVFGAKIAQYSDPDGLVFSVGEERGTR